MSQRTVLFVCTGNTCRSPMAAAAFAHLCREAGCTDVTVRSAGLNAAADDAMSPQARFALWHHGIPAPEAHTSQPLTRELAASAERIVVMTRAHASELTRRFPELATRTNLLLTDPERDVPDPFGGGSETYIQCLALMLPGLHALMNDVARSRSARQP